MKAVFRGGRPRCLVENKKKKTGNKIPESSHFRVIDSGRACLLFLHAKAIGGEGREIPEINVVAGEGSDPDKSFMEGPRVTNPINQFACATFVGIAEQKKNEFIIQGVNGVAIPQESLDILCHVVRSLATADKYQRQISTVSFREGQFMLNQPLELSIITYHVKFPHLL
ncbi:MAG: hypothetical protein ACLFUS_08845 [Candidatus Sumerlaeia bacterium]